MYECFTVWFREAGLIHPRCCGFCGCISPASRNLKSDCCHSTHSCTADAACSGFRTNVSPRDTLAGNIPFSNICMVLSNSCNFKRFLFSVKKCKVSSLQRKSLIANEKRTGNYIRSVIKVSSKCHRSVIKVSSKCHGFAIHTSPSLMGRGGAVRCTAEG